MNTTNENNPLNNFVMYEIVISEAERILSNPKFPVTYALDNASKLFGSLFSGKKLNIYQMRRKKDGPEPEIYANDIMSARDGVYLLRLNNNKNTKMVEKANTATNGIPDYEENTYISNPFCYVVVDNRAEKGIRQMAIQKNSAWGDTAKVRDLLNQNLQRMFNDAGIPLDIHITPKMRTSKIWEFCKQRCSVGQDAIKRIAFDFPNQRKLSSIDRIQKPQGYVRQLANLMNLTDAIKTHISLEYEHADPDKLEENANDLAHIVNVCTHKDYNLSIQFKHYGWYKCNEMVRAIFPMEERLMNAFIHDFKSASAEGEKYELLNWCNNVYEQSKLFDYAEQIPNKRHR